MQLGSKNIDRIFHDSSDQEEQPVAVVRKHFFSSADSELTRKDCTRVSVRVTLVTAAALIISLGYQIRAPSHRFSTTCEHRRRGCLVWDTLQSGRDSVGIANLRFVNSASAAPGTGISSRLQALGC